MDKSVMLIGSNGMIGSALRNSILHNHARFFYFSDRSSCEITDEQEVFDEVSHFRPTHVIIAAAYSNVDACETDRTARKVNVDGVRNIVRACLQFKATPIFLSSSYVFSGSKELPYTVEDKPMPINMYGVQKLLGEAEVLKARGLVVRTVGVFGEDPKRKAFPYQVVDTVSRGELFSVPTNQFMNPIYAPDLATAIIHLGIEKEEHGIAHVAGSQNMSKFDFAQLVARTAGLDEEMIREVDMKQVAARPRNACLKNSHPGTSYDVRVSMEKWWKNAKG